MQEIYTRDKYMAPVRSEVRIICIPVSPCKSWNCREENTTLLARMGTACWIEKLYAFSGQDVLRIAAREGDFRSTSLQPTEIYNSRERPAVVLTLESSDAHTQVVRFEALRDAYNVGSVGICFVR
jgi:hypothetical protein